MALRHSLFLHVAPTVRATSHTSAHFMSMSLRLARRPGLCLLGGRRVVSYRDRPGAARPWRAQTCQSLRSLARPSKDSRAFQRLAEPPEPSSPSRAFKTVPEPSRDRQNRSQSLAESSRALHNLLKRPKTFQCFPAPSSFKNFHNLPKGSKGFQSYSEPSKAVQVL